MGKNRIKCEICKKRNARGVYVANLNGEVVGKYRVCIKCRDRLHYKFTNQAKARGMDTTYEEVVHRDLARDKLLRVHGN